MKIEDAIALAEALMIEHGLWQKGWTLHTSRALRTFGACSHHLKRIKLSVHLVELNTEEKVRDTILHEIAHALLPREAFHGPLWKDKARSIGARPVACYSSKDVTFVPGKYVGTCTKCGKVVYKHRWNRRIESNGYSHNNCGGDFTWKY